MAFDAGVRFQAMSALEKLRVTGQVVKPRKKAAVKTKKIAKKAVIKPEKIAKEVVVKPQKIVKGLKQSQKEFRARRMALLAIIKSAPCMDCNKKFPPECMDFDHVRGKNRGIGTTRYTFDQMLAEIELCDLVCSNCHRTRTKKRHEAAQKQAVT